MKAMTKKEAKKKDKKLMWAIFLMPLLLIAASEIWGGWGFIVAFIVLLVPEAEMSYISSLYDEVGKKKKVSYFDKKGGSFIVAMFLMTCYGLIGEVLIVRLAIKLLIKHLPDICRWFANNCGNVLLGLLGMIVSILAILVIVKLIGIYMKWNKNIAIKILGKKRVK